MKLIVHNDKPQPPPPPPSEAELKKMAQQALVRAAKRHPTKLIIIADVGEEVPEVWASGVGRNDAIRMARFGMDCILEDL